MIILILVGLMICIAFLLIRHKRKKGRQYAPVQIPTLIFTCSCELGNTLRGLSSAHILSKYSGRPLYIYYQGILPNVSAALSYFVKNTANDDDIILPSSNTSNDIEFLGMWSRGIDTRKNAMSNQFRWITGKWTDYLTTCDPHLEGYININTLKTCTHHLAMDFYIALSPDCLTIEQFKAERFQWYQEHIVLEERELAREFISTLRLQLNNNKTTIIGVHVRYSDNWTDKNKIKAGLNTPLSAFISKLNVEAQQNPNAYFLLCTDNFSKIESALSSNIQNNRLIRPSVRWTDQCDRYKEQCNQSLQAMWEMLLLGQTDYIIGSRASTFSYEAAYMGDRDILPLHLYDSQTNEWEIL